MPSEGLKEGPRGRVVVDKVRVAPAAVVAGGKQNSAYAETFRTSTFHGLQPLWKESLFPGNLGREDECNQTHLGAQYHARWCQGNGILYLSISRICNCPQSRNVVKDQSITMQERLVPLYFLKRSSNEGQAKQIHKLNFRNVSCIDYDKNNSSQPCTTLCCLLMMSQKHDEHLSD